jgi:hypothetical protein
MLSFSPLALCFALTIECVALSCAAAAQKQNLQMPQGQSVVDAARRSRQQQKAVARQPRVITNDDLEPPREQKTEAHPAGTVALSQFANESGVPINKDSGAKDVEPEQTATDKLEIARLKGQVAEAERKLKLQERELALAQEAISVDDEMAGLRDQVAEAERDLNLQRRELALPQQEIYSNPRYLVNHAGQPQLDSQQQRYIESQQEINGLKERYADLQWYQWQLKQAATPDKRVPPPS